MRSLTLLSAVLLATLATAQPSFVGEPFPLTQTRYGAIRADSLRLVSDDRDFFVFWSTGANIRMTKAVAGERRVGKPVAAIGDDSVTNTFDVVWTGQHFLLAAADEDKLFVQRVSVDGEKIGEPVTIADDVTDPRIAWNGTVAVVLYWEPMSLPDRLFSTTLNADGAVLRSGQELLPRGGKTAVTWFDIASNGNGFAAVAWRQPEGESVFTLDRNGVLRLWQSLGGESHGGQIVSDGGHGYIWARNSRDRSQVVLSRVDANGTVTETVTIDHAGGLTSFARTAEGFAMTVAYQSNLYVIHLDEAFERRPEIESAPLEIRRYWSSLPDLAAAGDRLMAGWTEGQHGYVTEIPFPSTRGRLALFGAAEQRLLATTSSSDSTLFIWQEDAEGVSSVRTGVRASDGTWVEQALFPETEFVYGGMLAVSNGREFLVGRNSGEGHVFLRRLSSRGEPIGDWFRVRVPMSVAQMLWNGERYVFVGGAYAFNAEQAGYMDIRVATMTEDGTVSAAVRIHRAETVLADAPRLAWNGRTYLALWNTPDQVDLASFNTTRGTRLNADLQRLDTEDLALGTTALHSGAEVVWDGSEFVVLSPRGGIYSARVSASSGRVSSFFRVPGTRSTTYLRAVRVEGGVALTWVDDRHTQYVTVLRQGGAAVLNRTLVPAYGTNVTFPRIAAAPGGKAVFATTAAVDAPPHHGASRVVTAVLDLAPLSPITTAPRVTVRREGNNKLIIDWSAVPQPVTGYRVEYRIGDGNWNELDRSPDPNVRAATFTVTRPEATHAFRVRAMNDAGMGPYSPPATPAPARRRSVR